MKVEKITQAQVNGLMSALSPMARMVCGLPDVDITKGRGVLGTSGLEHCLWTKEGKRITISVIATGGIMASLSKEIDSDIPK